MKDEPPRSVAPSERESPGLDTRSCILCVDDEASVLAALRRMFRGKADVITASSGSEALKLLRDTRVDVIISDMRMPNMTGAQMFLEIEARRLAPDAARIMLTGYTDFAELETLINDCRVDKFFFKPWETETVLDAVDRELRNRSLEARNRALAEELKRKNRELEILSNTDQLTGLNNRRKLEQIICTEVNRHPRAKSNLSIILFDIDHFKRINDLHGHPTGDSVLIEVARAVQQGVRLTDSVGRWGGEEFLIVCTDTDLKGAETLAEKIRLTLANLRLNQVEQISASFGVVQYRTEESIQTLIQRADELLYQAKNSGRNRVESSNF